VSIFVAGDAREAAAICRTYCDEVGYCVTVTETRYCYRGGEEPGVIIGLINYPRHPATPDVIFAHAEVLTRRLIEQLDQQSASIQAPDKTVWLSFRPEDIEQ
jgi:hypothetical protein